MTARRRRSWPDPLRRRQESPAQTRHAPAPVQRVKGVGEGTFFLVRTLRVRLGVRFQRAVPPAPSGAGARSRLAKRTSCCCVAAVQGPGTMGSGFRIYLPDLGGAKGIRTPDLLHAMRLSLAPGAVWKRLGRQLTCPTSVYKSPEWSRSVGTVATRSVPSQAHDHGSSAALPCSQAAQGPVAAGSLCGGGTVYPL